MNQQTSQLPPQTNNGRQKLDLANVMKLCGIMDDDDFMDTDETPQCSTSYDTPSSLNATQQNDSDCRSNALYLEGTRPIEDNNRWLTIPYVQNTTDLTNNRVSNMGRVTNTVQTSTYYNLIYYHSIFSGFFIHHTID